MIMGEQPETINWLQMRWHPARAEITTKKATHRCHQVRPCAWGDGSPVPPPAATGCWGTSSGCFSGAATYWITELGIPHYSHPALRPVPLYQRQTPPVAVWEPLLVVCGMGETVGAHTRIWGFASGFQRCLLFFCKILFYSFQLTVFVDSVKPSIKGHKLSFNDHTKLQNKFLFFFFANQVLCNTADWAYLSLRKMESMW